MAKLLRLRDYILLTAAMVGDIGEEIRLVGGLIPFAMEVRYGIVPAKYKKASYLTTVSRMLKTGDIKKVIDSRGNPVLELSAIGVTRLKRRFPVLSLQKGKWDGSFMVVVFDIPEKKRGIRRFLRLKLVELGFGLLQESVYISPYHFEDDIKELLNGKKLTDYALVFTAKTILSGNLKEFARKIWKLDVLDKEYLDIAEEADRLRRGRVKNLGKKKLWEKYIETVSRDPFLPRELLPGNWGRETAMKAIENLALTKLSRSAQNNQG